MNIHSAPSSPSKYKDPNSSFSQSRKTEEPSKQRLKLTHLQSTTPEIERPSSPAVSASVSNNFLLFDFYYTILHIFHLNIY